MSNTITEQEDLFVHRQFTIDRGQEPLRIDKFLMGRIEGISRTKVQIGIEAGNVLVNGLPTKNNYKVKPFDSITVVYSEEPVDYFLIPEKMNLNIVFEDDYIVLVNKEPGMVVHPAYGNYRGTLVNALAYRFQNLPKTTTKLNNDLYLERPGLVHRIDKNTSGIIIIAKTEMAMVKLAKEFFDRTMHRKYIAIVWGDLKEDTGTITANVGRNLKNRKIMDTFPTDSELGKHAVTHYTVLERFGYLTFIECRLETGRTHQIRVHFKSIGHPLFNDNEYGGDIILKGINSAKYKQFIQNCFQILPRHALHAKTLGITHPATGEKLFFDSEIPNDMQALLDKWRKYTKDKLLE
jgi:23S rRNA pseudouridine1911/1915/1917 synthase